MKIILSLSILMLLSACSPQLQLISRKNNGNGTGVAHIIGKEVSITLNNKEYEGTYVYDGGQNVNTTSYGTATAYSGTQNINIYANGQSNTYVPGTGNGKLIATSGNDTLRCDFNFRHGTGVGYCINNNGSEYDLIIHY
jgi:hypothetical protein